MHLDLRGDLTFAPTTQSIATLKVAIVAAASTLIQRGTTLQETVQ